MKKAIGLLFLVVGVVSADVSQDVFYVYQDSGSRLNHSIPAGWMGDFSDMHLNQRWEKGPAKGKYCIQIKYSAERKQNAGWAGIYWQSTPNNWGEAKTKGYDLKGYTKLKFMARGETGKEAIEKFMFGGVSGSQSFDTDSNQTDLIELTKEWKTYEISLDKLDMSGIISPFCLVFSAESNPAGATVYLDEIRYEK